MLDRNKVIDYLKNTIKSCEAVGTHLDKAIIWECNRSRNA